MWNNYFNRPRRDIPQVNYESSEDEYDSPLVSPSRPLPTRAGSPVDLAVPTLNDNVDEELEAVSQVLRNVGHTHTYRGTHPSAPRVRPDPEGGAQDEPPIEEEEVVQGIVVGGGETQVCADNMPPIVSFESEDGADEAGAHKEACSRVEKVNWDKNDLLFTFSQIERKMAAAGVKKNFTKFQVLSEILPKEVADEVKPLLRKDEADFPDKNAYKQLKDGVLRIFGPRPEDPIERALGRVMSGKPSQLARALVDDICKAEFDCRCCPAVVSTLWKRHLPSNVRAGIASSVLDKNSFDMVVKLADDIHASNAPWPSISAVRAVPVAIDETQPALQYPVDLEVNAIRNGRGGRGGRGNRGGRGGRGGRGRGGGRGGQNGQNQSNSGQSNQSNQSSQSGGARPRGTRHPDLPEGDGFCNMHFRWGRGAFFCSDPGSCPWKNVFTPKQ